MAESLSGLMKKETLGASAKAGISHDIISDVKLHLDDKLKGHSSPLVF